MTTFLARITLIYGFSLVTLSQKKIIVQYLIGNIRCKVPSFSGFVLRFIGRSIIS